MCCAARRSTIKRRTCAPVTATTTARTTVTTTSVSVRRALCGRHSAGHAGIRRPPFGVSREACRCKVQAAVPCRIASRMFFEPARRASAESTIGPAGLVGRKARTPCRALSISRDIPIRFRAGIQTPARGNRLVGGGWLSIAVPPSRLRCVHRSPYHNLRSFLLEPASEDNSQRTALSLRAQPPDSHTSIAATPQCQSQDHAPSDVPGLCGIWYVDRGGVLHWYRGNGNPWLD